MGGEEAALKCGWCGLIFRTVEAAELHAKDYNDIIYECTNIEMKGEKDIRKKEVYGINLNKGEGEEKAREKIHDINLNPNKEGHEEKAREKIYGKLDDIRTKRVYDKNLTKKEIKKRWAKNQCKIGGYRRKKTEHWFA